MATDPNSPDVIMVPVTRHDVVVKLEDIMTQLTQTGDHLIRARVSTAADPQVAKLLLKFTDLVRQLKDVVDEINKIDPNLFASKRGPPPP